MQFLQSPVTSSLLGPNILLNTLFSNILSFLSSRNVSDQVSYPYKTIGKIIYLYIFFFNFLDKSYTGIRNKFQNNGMLLQSFFYHVTARCVFSWFKYVTILHTYHLWWCLFMDHVTFIVLSYMGKMRGFYGES